MGPSCRVDWFRQEKLRPRVLEQSESAFTLLGGNLAISASMPSGGPAILALRVELTDVVRSSGMLPSIDYACGVCPSLKHLNDAACRHTPRVLYVGVVYFCADISPWSLPLPLETMSENVSFMRARADFRTLIWLLQNKVLVCDCDNLPGNCWGNFLVSEFRCLYPNCVEGIVGVQADDVFESSGSSGSDSEFPHRQRNDTLASSGKQAVRRRLGQLVLDGLTPAQHLAASTSLVHPFASQLHCNKVLDLALSGNRCVESLTNLRYMASDIIADLAVATLRENDSLISLTSITINRVLNAYGKKNIVLHRELAFVCLPEDYSAIACLVTGLPMIGWAPPAFGNLPRVKPPANSLEDWLPDRSERNSKLLGRIRGTGDPELDSIAYAKTSEEVAAGVLLGPFRPDDLSFLCPCIAPRCGIWECHGNAETPGVRNIDDLLAGGQNSVAGSTFSHRPTDVDALAAQTRAVSERSPLSPLLGWTCDFSKAYKQVPGDPSQLHLLVLAQFNPVSLCADLFIPLTQVFGSKTSPINFARFPAVLIFLVAVLFMLPASHCVDDVIFIEEEGIAYSGKCSWDALMTVLGWKMAADKDTHPASLFSVIGVSLNLAPLPSAPATLLITLRRLESFREQIMKINERGSLGFGEAASWVGKLGFSLSTCFGKIGRC